ncbi:hypothetical protein DFH08DRAFT_821953 [Mycena albidolilacea]|uniref:Uncharacterized protein n=1 Tax=Mycena albidolilacea TaxID=1033008 RepID=A0AAD6Z977_9AGAR|nr:hypothetical protein DFH08DRAFT_821953 [Mycena albidolilacea]
MTGKREGHPSCGLHSWSVDQIDTSQAAQGRGRCRGLLLLQATFRVLEALEAEQEQAGQIYWSAFDGDGIQVVQEGGRHSEHPLLQATLVSEVLEAEQYRKAGGAGDPPHRRPYLNYTGGNVPGVAGNKVPPPGTPPAPGTSPAPGTPPPRPIWKKMTKAEARAVGLTEDPIYEYISANLWPLYETAKATIQGSKKTYISSKLHPTVDTEFDIGGPNGYNVDAFKEASQSNPLAVSEPDSLQGLYKILVNKDTHPPVGTVRANSGAKGGKPSKKPQATNTTKLYNKSHGAEVGDAMRAQLDASGKKPSKGEFLTAYNANMQKLFDASPPEVKAEMEAQASLHNAQLAAKPPPEHITDKQGRVYYHISKALRRIMGDNWGGYGHMVFQIYGGMEGVDGSHKRFRCSIGPDRTVSAFSSEHENSLMGDFKVWMADVLDPRGGPPRLQIDEHAEVRIPDVEADTLDAGTIRNLLDAYSVAREPDISVADAKEDQLRWLYNQMLVPQRAGKRISVHAASENPDDIANGNNDKGKGKASENPDANANRSKSKAGGDTSGNANDALDFSPPGIKAATVAAGHPPLPPPPSPPPSPTTPVIDPSNPSTMSPLSPLSTLEDEDIGHL